MSQTGNEMVILRTVARALAVVMWFGVLGAQAQTEPPAAPVDAAPPVATSPPAATSPATTATPEQAERLERFRGFIENTQDSDATRIAQAEELLLTGWPAATELAVAMLSADDKPSAKEILCQAIAGVGRGRPELLDNRLIEPLLALLGDPSEAIAQRAGAALSAFPDGGVVGSLSDLVARTEAPMKQRLAALAALTPNTNRREVVGELVELLDTGEPDIVARVVVALGRVSAVNHGNDIAAWKAWWEASRELSDQAWLDGQLTLYSQRLRQLRTEFDDFKAKSDQRFENLAGRLAQSLASIYRLTPQPQKDALLEVWMSDAAVEYRRVAVSLVAEQISEGVLPSEGLRAALRGRYADDSPEVRVLAIEIVGALNDPADAVALLARLEVERDPRVRESILRVLGKLRNLDAIGPLIAELNRDDALDRCVTAAADALGQLASRGQVEQSVVDSLVQPLKARFAKAGDGSVKIAILGAMAAIGSPEFKPEFEANLSDGQPELLLRAIQGVAIVGNGAQLERLGQLTAHPDARVRQRAISAIGGFGTEQQLPTITARMSASVETIEGPRVAAWQAFKQICDRLPLPAQVAAADRLADQPNYQADYLNALHERLATIKPAPPELAVVRENLAKHYVTLGRNAEALPLWRLLHEASAQAGDGRRCAFGLALVTCSLACGRTDQVDAVLQSISSCDAQTREAATSVVTAYLDQRRGGVDEADARAFAAKLAGLSPESFSALRTHLIQHFPASETGASPDPTGTN